MKSLKYSNKYDQEICENVVKECIETGNYSAVSRKHKIPITTITGWIDKTKKKDRPKQQRKETNALEKKIDDLTLENSILKELLKKTHQLWMKD